MNEENQCMAAGRDPAERYPAERLMQVIDLAGTGLAGIIGEVCPDGWEKNVARTQLEQALMWARAAITGKR